MVNLKIQLLGFFEIFGHPCPDIQGLAVIINSIPKYLFLLNFFAYLAYIGTESISVAFILAFQTLHPTRQVFWFYRTVQDHRGIWEIN